MARGETVLAKKRLRCSHRSDSSAILLVPEKPPKRFRGTPATAVCTREQSPDLYPEACPAVGSSPVGTNTFSRILRFPKETRAVWFLLGWLFLHRRLRHRQRGSTCVERLCYYRGRSVPRSATRFYPGASGKFPKEPSQQAFRLQRRASIAISNPLCDCPQIGVSPHRLPIPSLVTSPVRNATG